MPMCLVWRAEIFKFIGFFGKSRHGTFPANQIRVKSFCLNHFVTIVLVLTL
jgi:hypothetical protein